ncbi:MAG TPA: polysaccharide deacetylase family protein, partial [Myxococcota bacterium]|nr:polysaccharide deacetylase family protein [Myxococcota bacterium]
MTVSRHMAAVALLLVSGLFGAPHAVAAPLPLPRPVRAATHPVATAPIQVALTFDDLPSHGPFVTGIGPARAHGLILQALKEHDVPPTYGFINGNVLEDRPELRATLKAWVAAGNYLGNHTYSHYSLGAVPPAVYEADIDRNEPLL